MKALSTLLSDQPIRKTLSYGLVFLLLSLGISTAGFGQATNFHPTVQAARLRQALEYYRGLVSNQQWKTFPDKTCLKAGEADNCVPDLFTNLKLTGDLPLTVLQNDSVFDEKLLEGVKKFQRRHGLVADGIVGHKTLGALNVSLQRRIYQLELNLKRWEVDSAREAQPMVLVNIPDYSLYVLNQTGKVIWQTRVVVGQRGKEFHTQPLESRIGYFVLNPTWNVPKSIIWREIVPMLQTDPAYLTRNNMTVYRLTPKGGKVPVSPHSVNWNSSEVAEEKVQVIQSPGQDNALGRIKFLFANPYRIYLHDTPSKSLFNHPTRAYSHGCVRVQHPDILASILMNQNWNAPTLKPYPLLPLSITEKIVFLPTPVTVKIAYYTCWVNDAGEIHFREDIYGKDKTIQEAI